MGTMLRLTTIPRHCSPRSLTTTLLLSVSTNLRTLDTHRSGVQTSFVVGLFHLAWCPQVYLCYSIIAYVRISFLLRLNVYFMFCFHLPCSPSPPVSNRLLYSLLSSSSQAFLHLHYIFKSNQAVNRLKSQLHNSFQWKLHEDTKNIISENLFVIQFLKKFYFIEV